MRFDKLRLNGFKSFVDPTDLPVVDGLTGVVGPNGCGKSNLLEAMRWVMGETRPTAMRGAGMEDVIFAGAASRPARPFAEVTLSLDNADRTAPAGFNDADRIDVVRRIARDAGSTYRLNGREVRARDVQVLFADAGTGAHSPALVRQGQIAELIAAKPHARRRILEEAAGIGGLYQRRHEADLRLDAAESNLDRLAQVADRLETQLSSLTRQAGQARRYRELSQSLRDAEATLAWRRARDADADAAGADAALRDARAIVARTARNVATAGAARQAGDDALPPLREEAAVGAALVQRIAAARDALAGRVEAAERAVADLADRLGQARQDAAAEAARVADAAATVARLEEGLDRARREAAAAEAARPDADRAADGAQHDAAEAERAVATVAEATADLTARHRAADDRAAQVARDLSRAEAADRAARDAEAGADRAVAARGAEVAAAERARDDAAAALRDAEAALEAADAARIAAQDRARGTEAERARTAAARATLGAEVASLRDALGRDPAAGDRLIDAVSARPGYEAALAAALDDALQGGPAGPDGAGWHALPPLDGTDVAGAVPLSDHVDVPDALARRVAATGIVDDADGTDRHAALGPGQVLVSREGAVWRWDGLHRPATAEAAPNALRLERVNRLAAAERELAEADAAADAAKAGHDVAATALRDARAAEDAARSDRNAADAAALRAGRDLARLDGQRDRDAAAFDAARDRAATARDDLVRLRRDAAEAVEARDALPPLDDARNRLAAAKDAADAARAAARAARAQADGLDRGAADASRRAADLSRDLDDWRRRAVDADGRGDALEGRVAALTADLSRARARPVELAGEADGLDRQGATAAARDAAARDALSRAEGVARDAATAERDAERAAAAAREVAARAEERVATARAAAAAAWAALAEASGTTADVVGARLELRDADTPDVETLTATVAALRRKRDALGSVNLRAEEDAAAVRAERDALAAERADLDAAIGALREGIAKLNQEGRQRLRDAFRTVNANFAALFGHLFGGGEARLEMVESDDPLDAGLEILCQPPGKRLATLSLLSGGEQTLTALAMIFAVFLANPAPICVLDEVDAPLDDANVARFCDLLDEMTNRTATRFLIITHHAVTMSRMDRLFGVTMVEAGVSQLVSVDLRAAEEMVA
ncbi:chromosome segregation SMC family protein [Jannaschia sp. LMIT008]|uniref:chromosome segregation SMC family protein n=1 Tax=Jannaschia maritima TaxID=3032585 RepID=UPI002811FA06|nr:AAA family ATPase [Jannaschia sp. LMIT008]